MPSEKQPIDTHAMPRGVLQRLPHFWPHFWPRLMPLLGMLLLLSSCTRTMHMRISSEPEINQGRPYHLVVEPSNEALPPMTYEEASAEVVGPAQRSLYRKALVPEGPDLELSFKCKRGRFITLWMYYLVANPLEFPGWRECVALKCQRSETFVVGQQNGLTCDAVEKSQQAPSAEGAPDLSKVKAPDPTKIKVPDGVKIPGQK
ncbi:MAG: hypothetical protein ACKO6N_14525 [Myxococcota bacterium]